MASTSVLKLPGTGGAFTVRALRFLFCGAAPEVIEFPDFEVSDLEVSEAEDWPSDDPQISEED